MNVTAPQERIEQNVRMVLGDMHVQLIVAQARIAELEAHIAELEAAAEPKEGPAKANGKDKTAEARQ